MHRLTAASVAAIALLSAGVVSAQTYYSLPSSSGSASGACVNITNDVSLGANGSQVSQLQTFLAAQNYPGGGSWMITGHFGAATETAVRDFQQTRGLPLSGRADAPTRAAIARASCPLAPAAPSFLPPTAYAPASVPASVHFTEPAATATYPSNAFNPTNPFNPFNPFDVCSGGYNFSGACYPATVGATINSMTPVSGGVGTLVTLTGSNFSPAGNTIHFGQGIIPNVPSQDGTTIQFVVPPKLYGARSREIPFPPGGYSVSVANALGLSHNSLPFNFTPVLGLVPPPVPLSDISAIVGISGPASLRLGAQGTWTLSVNPAAGDPSVSTSISVHWGDELTSGYSSVIIVPSYAGGPLPKTVTFSHAYAASGPYTIEFLLGQSGGYEKKSTANVVVSN